MKLNDRITGITGGSKPIAEVCRDAAFALMKDCIIDDVIAATFAATMSNGLEPDGPISRACFRSYQSGFAKALELIITGKLDIKSIEKDL
jgi:hypothetical protein